jgi:teichuronic acid biosynthesis glycosyltransferase TuaG
MDLVSIIIPYFKKKKFIKKSIRSVLNQTYKNIELIIIYDDNNKNDLNYLLKNFGKNKKITIITNVKNLGAGLSRNKGIQNAKGKYIAFLDADDVWHESKIFKQIDFMKKFNFKISHTSYEIINASNKVLSCRKARNFFSYKELLKSCDIGLSTVMIEKNIINDELKFVNLKTKEDFVLWLKILRSGIPIGALDVKLSYWRKTKNSLSSSILQKLKDGYRVYRVHMSYNAIKSLYLLFFFH